MPENLKEDRAVGLGEPGCPGKPDKGRGGCHLGCAPEVAEVHPIQSASTGLEECELTRGGMGGQKGWRLRGLGGHGGGAEKLDGPLGCVTVKKRRQVEGR